MGEAGVSVFWPTAGFEERTINLRSHHHHHHYPSRQLAYRTATKLSHPCLSLASLWMVPQLWFMFCPSVVDENSPILLTPRTQWLKIHPWLLHGETLTVYVGGENSPMTFTLWNSHGLPRWWKFAHDSNTVFDFVAIFQIFKFTTSFVVNKRRKEILIESWNFIAEAQNLKEFWSFDSHGKCESV